MDVSRPILGKYKFWYLEPSRVKVQKKPDVLRFLKDCRHKVLECSRPRASTSGSRQRCLGMGQDETTYLILLDEDTACVSP